MRSSAAETGQQGLHVVEPVLADGGDDADDVAALGRGVDEVTRELSV